MLVKVRPPRITLLRAVSSVRGVSRDQVAAEVRGFQPDNQQPLVCMQGFEMLLTYLAQSRVSRDPYGTSQIALLTGTADFNIVLGTAGAGWQSCLLQEDNMQLQSGKLSA